MKGTPESRDALGASGKEAFGERCETLRVSASFLYSIISRRKAGNAKLRLRP